MEEISIVQISHPRDQSKKLIFLLKERLTDEPSAIRNIVSYLLIASHQEITQLNYAFNNTKTFGDKRCAADFWDKLNKITGEALNDIEDFSSYIQDIKAHEELIMYIFDLPDDTIKSIIFTLVSQYAESIITFG